MRRVLRCVARKVFKYDPSRGQEEGSLLVKEIGTYLGFVLGWDSFIPVAERSCFRLEERTGSSTLPTGSRRGRRSIRGSHPMALFRV